MRTTNEVIKCYGHDALVRSFVRSVGRDSIKDIYNHGADQGFPGITMTRDCIAFAWRHRASILTLLEQDTDDFGEEVGPMMQGWKCIGKDYSTTEIVRSLYIERQPKWDNDTELTVWNALAWYAAETVARWFCD